MGNKGSGKALLRIRQWWVKVESVDEGGNGTSTLMFETKEEADRVQPGYKFQH